MVKKYEKKIKLLGNRVKELRLEKGMTQQTLSDLCEVDIRTIQRIEKGEFGAGLHIIFYLADAFEITVTELFQID